MKKYLSVVILTIFCSVASPAQKLTLDDIYKYYVYYHNYFFDECNVYGNSIYYGPYRIPFTSENNLFPANKIQQIPQVPNSVELKVNKQESIAIFSNDLAALRRNSAIGSYQFIQLNSSDTCAKPLIKDNNIQLINPIFSPDGEKLCFVHNNNLCYTSFDGNLTYITTDGKDGEKINGLPNLVYEEEFSMTTAYWWSPDSKKILFLSFDESHIKDRPLYLYDAEETVDAQLQFQKYSFAGEKNAVITAFTYDLEHNKIEEIPVPQDVFDASYIPSATWINENELTLSYLNRRQNHEQIYIFNIKDKSFKKITDNLSVYINKSEIYPIPNEPNRFLLITDNYYDNKYIYIWNGTEREKDFWGPITDFYGYFSEDSTIRFQTQGNTLRDRNIVSLNIYTKVSTILSETTGWNEAKFSSNGQHFLLNHNEINIKENSEYTCSMKIDHGKVDTLWTRYENSTIHNFSYSDFQLAPIEWISIPSENLTLNAYIIKPKLKKKQKCPVYVTVYGGPTEQIVVNAYNYETFWFQYLVQQGYAVVVVDPRSSTGRGTNFEKQVYGKLGTMQAKDMHHVANYLKSLPYVDGNNLAIEGWSFGGYLSLLTATKYPDDYKAVIAIAPVADWRMYDNIYSEKYMGLPEENTEGYENSNVLTNIKNLQASVLIAYGTADDNVRNCNEMAIIRECINNEKDVRTLLFPGDNHNLAGYHSRIFLIRNMFKFLEENLK
ncbi:MAG: DPP IV N-terminal domain-containing protein [Bacteroidales bacterium]|nr:DPP IV N-terminal domain-containing protein [Bacteroidales bacterium]